MHVSLVAIHELGIQKAALSLASLVASQQIGTFTPEVHPPVSFQTCTTSGGCATQNGSVVLDANYRWLHTASGDTCNPSGFNRTICPDAETCGESCALDGADYNGTYGITTTGNAVNLVFGNGGSRVYLLDDTGNYVNFKVMNQEFTFDVDVSNLPCAYNGALYFSEMPPDGGLSPTNKAGAAYGTGYCDSQCPKGINFINGTTNVDGSLGSCCNEMDLWEANSVATQLTPHPCNVTGEFVCTGNACSNLCDPSGCDFNPFRMGNQSFYGPGKIVDTTKPFTVVTQFVTDDNTPTGTLSSINRIYVQDGVVIQNSKTTLPGLPAANALTQDFCTDKETVLHDAASFNTFGGMAQMGTSLARGAVLVMSLWDDLSGGMTWLDGSTGDSSTPGAVRGPCTSADVVLTPTAAVTFSNIKVGDLNSTFESTVPPATPPPQSPSQVQWGQCGGVFYSGPTTCASPYKCVYSNPYYSQCL
ncbi:major cellobiohydrolase [Dendrothele bispora CBS 962.96]|uniref:Glucanase n=1 Tax=Dendrothele bispora (strain CBS 962.96) TaxID=1314807 RepID=A0A4S8L1Y0_DENBC|nr:major cellobiohydrolase [Dendrothele bispora CBS 962.96]